MIDNVLRSETWFGQETQQTIYLNQVITTGSFSSVIWTPPLEWPEPVVAERLDRLPVGLSRRRLPRSVPQLRARGAERPRRSRRKRLRVWERVVVVPIAA